MRTHGRALSICMFAYMSLIACGAKFQDEAKKPTIYVRVPKNLFTENATLAKTFDMDHRQDEHYVFGYMPRITLATLPPSIQNEIRELDQRYETFSFDTETLTFFQNPVDLETLKEGYHNYDELTDELESLAAQYPHIAHLESAGKTVLNREMWFMKIANQPTVDTDKPKLLYIGNMHGNEVVGREMMIYLIRKLLKEYQTSARIKALVDNAQIYIMPSMNNDGFELQQRQNAHHEDLNRNFPDFVGDPTNTPEGREPEVQNVMALHKKHHFLLALNFHGGALCVNIPWDTKKNNLTSEKFGDDPLMLSLAHEYADANTFMQSNGGFDRGVTYGYEWTRIVGGMQDYASFYERSIHATIELTRDYWPLSSTLAGFWSQNEESLVRFLEQGLRGLHVRVENPDGQLLSNVAVRVSSAPQRTVIYDNGIVSKPTLAGSQKAWLSADGYRAQEISFDASYFRGNRQTVVLQPNF